MSMRLCVPNRKSDVGTILSSTQGFKAWLMCTADTWAEQTDEWLGELGSDLQGPMDSCCFFLVATIF